MDQNTLEQLIQEYLKKIRVRDPGFLGIKPPPPESGKEDDVDPKFFRDKNALFDAVSIEIRKSEKIKQLAFTAFKLVGGKEIIEDLLDSSFRIPTEIMLTDPRSSKEKIEPILGLLEHLQATDEFMYREFRKAVDFRPNKSGRKMVSFVNHDRPFDDIVLKTKIFWTLFDQDELENIYVFDGKKKSKSFPDMSITLSSLQNLIHDLISQIKLHIENVQNAGPISPNMGFRATVVKEFHICLQKYAEQFETFGRRLPSNSLNAAFSQAVCDACRRDIVGELSAKDVHRILSRLQAKQSTR